MSSLFAGLRGLLRRGKRRPVPVEPDRVGAHLHAAVSANVRARLACSQTYEVRVQAMIDDFFSKYEDRDARPHP